MDFRIGIKEFRIVVAVYIALNIIHLITFINSLRAIDDNKEVLKANWGKYAFLILITIFYLLATAGAAAALGFSFQPDFLNSSVSCTANL